MNDVANDYLGYGRTIRLQIEAKLAVENAADDSDTELARILSNCVGQKVLKAAQALRAAGELTVRTTSPSDYASDRNRTIGTLILARIDEGATPGKAFDMVMGEGAYRNLAGDLYDSLRAKAATNATQVH